MAAETSPTPETCDVFVVGAGLAGAAAAIGFARAGFSTVSCGPIDRLGQGRTVALFGRSIELLREFGVWDEVEAARRRCVRCASSTTPARCSPRARSNSTPRRSDSTRSAGTSRTPRWRTLLARPLDACPGLDAHAGRGRSASTSLPMRPSSRPPTGDDIRPGWSSAPTDEARPRAKRPASTRTLHRYGQSALTLFLAHTRPHDDFSTEFHTREGPFTLVPLPPTDKAAYRSSLVWVMSESRAAAASALNEADLIGEIERSRAACSARSHSRAAAGCSRWSARRAGADGDATRAGRRRRARLSADRRAGPEPRPARRRGTAEAARARARQRDATSAPPPRSPIMRAARGPDIAARMLAVNGLNLRCSRIFAPSTHCAASGSPRCAMSGRLRRLVMREGVSPMLGR